MATLRRRDQMELVTSASTRWKQVKSMCPRIAHIVVGWEVVVQASDIAQVVDGIARGNLNRPGLARPKHTAGSVGVSVIRTITFAGGVGAFRRGH